MTQPVRFLQIHTLHSYPAALLNRDETGMAKRIAYGGAVRTRISSQCLKRHWRTARDPWAWSRMEHVSPGVRSRQVIELQVLPWVQANTQAPPEIVAALAAPLNSSIYGAAELSKRQPLMLGLPEVEFLQQQALAIAEAHPEDPDAAAQAAAGLFSDKSQAANWKAFRQSAYLPAGIENALFGRMVTADPAANIEAAVSVAHAFTVHRDEPETEYFTAIDDLQQETAGPATAHIGTTELTSGLYYGYVVVDLPELVSNLEGCAASQWLEADRQTAAEAVVRLLRLIATISPGAKKGSTAPYSYAELLLLEAGQTQPRTLAAAFRDPVPPQLTAAGTALADQLSRLDQAYGAETARRLLTVQPQIRLPAAPPANLEQIGDWCRQAILTGQAE